MNRAAWAAADSCTLHSTQQITRKEKINSGVVDGGKRKNVLCAKEFSSSTLSDDVYFPITKTCDLPLGNKTLLVICGKIFKSLLLC
jgi:hypothetical protein